MHNFLRVRRLEIFIIVVIIGVIGVIYALTRTASAPGTVSSTDATGSNVQQVPSTTVSYQGMDGRNALDLLKVFHRVDTKSTSFGPMVIGIDGLQPTSSQYWAFYVNGNLADTGADQYITKTGDNIEWRLVSQ